MTPGVDVVVCMDTEGPCSDPGNPELLGTWQAVDAAMDKLFDDGFRARYPDPGGGRLRFGWFFLTWTGFSTNPRSRDFGYHRVRDHYLERWGDALGRYGDEQCWHYHHPPASGVGNEWGVDWSLGDEYARIVSLQLLDRAWFPVCYRAGGTIMDAASSRWVDSWFPFDYSNRAPLTLPGLVDWSSGVKEWGLYHPDPEDFRRPGRGRRRLVRCLDLRTGVHVLDESDVESAFARAHAGRPAILACFDHDYRDIEDRIDAFRELVRSVASRYPGVPWRYAAPVEAARRYLDVPCQPPLRLEASWTGRVLHIWSSEPVFQSTPWIAARTVDGEVVAAENEVVRVDTRRWQWEPSPELDWAEVAVGASSDLGEAAAIRISPRIGPGRLFLESDVHTHPLRPRSIWEHSKAYVRSAVDRATGAEPEMDAAAQAAELLGRRLERGASVLDVGCGPGHLWRSLAPLGFRYHGIDPYDRAIQIGRQVLAAEGLPASRLRTLAIEELPPEERYDTVVSLSTLLYAPDFRQPLEVMARAADRLLVVRSSFGHETVIRYLPDKLLEPGFRGMRAYFSIFARGAVEAFLEREGFRVEWLEDRRQAERFGGAPEVVGDIALPYEWLVAERVGPPPSEQRLLEELGG